MGTRKKVDSKVTKRQTREKVRQTRHARKNAMIRRRVKKLREERLQSYEEQQKAKAVKDLKVREERAAAYAKRHLITVGVRFPHDPGQLYTYLVEESLSTTMYLGMEVVVKTREEGYSRCCYVVRIDEGITMPPDYNGELKQITLKVVAL